MTSRGKSLGAGRAGAEALVGRVAGRRRAEVGLALRSMLTFTEKDPSIDLPYVLEQARVRGAVRVRREDGQAFVILPAAAGSLSDRVADEQEIWLNTLAPVTAVQDDLPCSECGYNLRKLPVAGHRR